MKIARRLFLSALLLATPAIAAEPPPRPATSPNSPRVAVLTKRPPLGPYMGIVRIGGTREGAKGLPTLFAVAPVTTASTIHESPVLYCYSSGAQVIRFVLTFTAVRADAPLTETEVRMDSEGLYRIDLQAAGINLAPNTEYQWSISTLTGKESASKDTVTGGRIRRVPAPPALTARLAGEAKANPIQAFRDANLFYDAFAALIPQLEAQPKDAALVKTHTELLAQFGIVLPNTMRIPDPAGRLPEVKKGGNNSTAPTR